jgi:aminopeptidase N
LQIHDTDGFNKWEAGQTLALRNIERVMADPKTNIATFISDFGNLIAQGLDENTHVKADKALLARALTLPEISVIAQNQSVIDPAAIDQARTYLLKQIKQAHKDALAKLYDANADRGSFAITPEAMGKRALRNVLLEILTATKGTGCATRAKAHYFNANNMTDRVAALASLADSNQLEREEVFEHFYLTYKQYPLVVDKWFKLQAMGNRNSSFADFAKLRQHPEFNIKNPNRVRSLYTAFSLYNPVKFHDPSGIGYDLQRDVIIELNTINPQIAARQVNPFREWKRYTPQLQAHMQAALQAILDTPNLSNDVFEVVSKSLKG